MAGTPLFAPFMMLVCCCLRGTMCSTLTHRNNSRNSVELHGGDLESLESTHGADYYELLEGYSTSMGPDRPAALFAEHNDFAIYAPYSYRMGHYQNLTSMQRNETSLPLATTSSNRTSPKLIFVNSRFLDFVSIWERNLLQCPVACHITREAEAISTADAVIWNARWMSPLSAAPAVKPKGQRWVFNFHDEAPIYQGTHVNADTIETLAPHIDWTMTFRSKSDFWTPIGQLVPLTPQPGPQAPTVEATPLNPAAGRDSLLLWLVSNCVGPRLEVFQRIQRLLPPGKVDIFGNCGKPSPCPGRNESDACHQALFSRYKFYAAFENSRCDGYITEKFIRGLQGGMVPLVLGGLGRQDYEEIAPSDAFVHVDDFSSLKELAEYLSSVDKDDSAYNQFFSWRSHLRTRYYPEVMETALCELCQNLYDEPPKQRPTRSFGDLSTWWYQDTCRASGSVGNLTSRPSNEPHSQHVFRTDRNSRVIKEHFPPAGPQGKKNMHRSVGNLTSLPSNGSHSQSRTMIRVTRNISIKQLSPVRSQDEKTFIGARGRHGENSELGYSQDADFGQAVHAQPQPKHVGTAPAVFAAGLIKHIWAVHSAVWFLGGGFMLCITYLCFFHKRSNK